MLLLLLNSSRHSEETRNQEIYISNLETGALSQSSAGPWERVQNLWITVVERGEGNGQQRKGSGKEGAKAASSPVFAIAKADPELPPL